LGWWVGSGSVWVY